MPILLVFLQTYTCLFFQGSCRQIQSLYLHIQSLYLHDVAVANMQGLELFCHSFTPTDEAPLCFIMIFRCSYIQIQPIYYCLLVILYSCAQGQPFIDFKFSFCSYGFISCKPWHYPVARWFVFLYTDAVPVLYLFPLYSIYRYSLCTYMVILYSCIQTEPLYPCGSPVFIHKDTDVEPTSIHTWLSHIPTDKCSPVSTWSFCTST